jgi:hypothetical protein
LCAIASCGDNNGTLVFYDAATGGNVVQSACRTDVGTSTFYAACANADCESDRVAVTVTIYPVPTADGVITEGENENAPPLGNGTDDGIQKISDDVYQIRVSKTNTASLTVNNPTAGAAYTWTRVDCSNTSTTLDNTDANASLAPNGKDATFTITGADFADQYCFKVTATVDHGDGNICTASDIITLNTLAGAPRCNIVGPDPVCAGSTSNTYILDADAPPDNVADALNPDFN